MRIVGLWITAVFFLLGSSGCAKHLGNSPCAAHECFGQEVWQQAIDAIAEKNFPEAQYTGKVFSDPLRNAWTTDDNNVNISEDLLRELVRAGNPYVVSVAAHEIAHIRSNHYLIKAETSYVSHIKSLIHNMLSSKENEGADLNDNETVAILSRKHELEADALAVQYLAKMGYSKEDYLNFLNWIKINLKDASSTQLATHPPIRERIARIQAVEFSQPH